jgi:putative ABC transport system ATP-binding protein
MTELIELRGVSKKYRMGSAEVRALDGVDLAVTEGEFVAVMGPSGSGKSTLLHVLGLLDRPDEGTYLFGGQDTRGFSDRETARIRNREIGFVFQNFNLLHEETALQNVSLPLLYGRVRDAEVRAREALESVGLGKRAAHRPFELSGGEQQRVAIARALVKRPRLVLADEPTGNLDSAAGSAILDLLEGFHAKGITLVVITHDDRVGARARRILRMRDGRIEGEGAAGGGEAGKVTEPRA